MTTSPAHPAGSIALPARCNLAFPAIADDPATPKRSKPETVNVKGKRPDAYASGMQTRTTHVDAGPLGENTSILDVP